MTDVWTHSEKIKALLGLTWTVQVERSDDDAYYVARVLELPDVIATGTSDRELAGDLFDSLEASIEARIDIEGALPLPPGGMAPWLAGKPARGAGVRNVPAKLGGDAWKGAAIPWLVNYASSATVAAT